MTREERKELLDIVRNMKNNLYNAQLVELERKLSVLEKNLNDDLEVERKMSQLAKLKRKREGLITSINQRINSRVSFDRGLAAGLEVALTIVNDEINTLDKEIAEKMEVL